MKVIAVSNPKGGSGKTTIITNLACFFSNWGFSVVVLDADSQSSAVDWAAARDDSQVRISVIPTSADKLVSRLENAQKTAVPKTVVLLDLPAGFSAELELAIYPYLDAMLVPTIASPIDVRAMVRHLFQLHKNFYDQEKSPATGVIINRARPYTRIHRDVLDKFLKRISYPLIGEIRETQNYPKAAHEGNGIVDFPMRLAIKDLLQWKPILEWLIAELFPEEDLDLFPMVDDPAQSE